MSPSTDALAALADRCAVRLERGIRVPTESDSISGLVPAFVAEPTSTSALADVLALASGCGAAIVVRGGGTKLGHRFTPARCDVLLDTRRLEGVIDHRQTEFVATIAAGTPLAVADRELGRLGQWIGLDPPFRDRATVGGVFAANDGGPHRLRLGAPRDRVLALRFVRADGQVIRAGAPVLKNVAGYDLARLMTGTAGILRRPGGRVRATGASAPLLSNAHRAPR